MSWQDRVREESLKSGIFVITVRGREEIRFDDPENQAVHKADVYGNLSRTFRFRGGIPWSVLQHSVLVSEIAAKYAEDAGLPKDLAAMYGMCHDYHEAYTGDLMFSWDAIRDEVKKAQDGFDKAIYKRLGVRPPGSRMRAIVKRADKDAMMLETKHFLTKTHPISRALCHQYKTKGDPLPTINMFSLITTLRAVSFDRLCKANDIGLAAGGAHW